MAQKYQFEYKINCQRFGIDGDNKPYFIQMIAQRVRFACFVYHMYVQKMENTTVFDKIQYVQIIG